MPKKTNQFSDKLLKLEQEKAVLIDKRRQEIVALIEKVGYLGLEDDMLVGMILFLKESSEKQPSELAPAAKTVLEQIKAKGTHFFRRKSRGGEKAKKQLSEAA